MSEGVWDLIRRSLFASWKYLSALRLSVEQFTMDSVVTC